MPKKNNPKPYAKYPPNVRRMLMRRDAQILRLAKANRDAAQACYDMRADRDRIAAELAALKQGPRLRTQVSEPMPQVETKAGPTWVGVTTKVAASDPDPAPQAGAVVVHVDDSLSMGEWDHDLRDEAEPQCWGEWRFNSGEPTTLPAMPGMTLALRKCVPWWRDLNRYANLRTGQWGCAIKIRADCTRFTASDFRPWMLVEAVPPVDWLVYECGGNRPTSHLFEAFIEPKHLGLMREWECKFDLPPRDVEGRMIPSPDAILAAVHTVTGVDPRMARRNRTGLLSRRTAVYSLRVMRNMSYPEIGEALGIVHSSAIDSFTKAENDPGVLAAANQVRRIIDMEVA